MPGCFKKEDILLKFIPACVSLIFLFTTAGAQNKDNYLELNSQSYGYTVFSTPESLEQELYVSNAFSLTVQTEKNNASVYVSLPYGIRTFYGQTISPENIVLKLNNTTCNSSYRRQVATGDVPLSTSNQLLFQQLKRNNYDATWYYDVTLKPLGYSVAPGFYYFTLQFTMTQP